MQQEKEAGEDADKKTPEQLKQEAIEREEKAKLILQELKSAVSEEKGRNDERVQKLENQMRELLQISSETWITKDKTLEELVTKLESRHDMINGQLQTRAFLSDSQLLQKVSGGRALQGILVTKNLLDQLQVRGRLLDVPESVTVGGASRSSDTIVQFSSTHDENNYKKTVDILGHSVAVSAKAGYGGISVGAGVSTSSRTEDENTTEHHFRETYSSTVKYFTMHVASYLFDFGDLKLSHDAIQDLKRALQFLRSEGINASNVQKACEDFFATYGSHVNRGPLQFGGNFWWTCSSRGFETSEKETVKKMQSKAISTSAEFSAFGCGVSTDVNIDKVKASYSGQCNSDTVANTRLEIRINGGPIEATDLSTWKSGLVANNSTWILTDRGEKLVAVWDIIQRNYKDKLGELGQVLKITWERMTGCVAEQSAQEILTHQPEVVIAEVRRWNERKDLSSQEIIDNLKFLCQVKQDILQKTSNPNIWIREYVEQPTVQQFIVMALSMTQTNQFERVKLILQQLIEKSDLDRFTTRTFPKIVHVKEMLYGSSQPESESIIMNIVDFQSFDEVLKKIINKAEIDQLNSSGPLLGSSKKPIDSKLSTNFSLAIHQLRSHYRKTYDDILINVLLYPYRSSNADDVVMLKPITLDCLQKLQMQFSVEYNKFKEFTNKSSLKRQAYLFHLAVCVCRGSSREQLKELLQYVKRSVSNLNPPLERELQDIPGNLRSVFELKQRLLFLTTTDPQEDRPLYSGSRELILEKVLRTEIADQKAIQADSFSVQHTNPTVETLMTTLGIHKYYPKRLTMQQALCIRPESLNFSLNKATPTDAKQLPFLVMHKIMAYDFLCRSDLIPSLNDGGGHSFHSDENSGDENSDSEHEQPQHDTRSNAGDSIGKVHPVDCLLSIILCSDDFLRQDLFSRLAKCQLAVPFILPDPFTRQLTLPVWALRSIVKDWKCIADNKEDVIEHTHPIVNYPMPIISFIRIGECQKRGKSKSKLLNEVISESHHDHFFHRNCAGGESTLLLGNGLVDMCWYLPAGELNDAFPDAVTFLNLHGDARNYQQQSKFLSRISSMCFALLTEESIEADARTEGVLRSFSSTPGGLTLLNDCESTLKTLKPLGHIIGLGSKTDYKTKEIIQKRIIKKINFKDIKSFKTLEQWSADDAVYDNNIHIDESGYAYNEGRRLADKVKGTLVASDSKQKMLPLHGPSMWHCWASNNKEVYRQTEREKSEEGYTVNEYSAMINKVKSDVRKCQLRHAESLSPVMQSFIQSLLKLQGPSNREVRNYFLQCLKLGLNNLSRERISSLQRDYQSSRKKLAEIESERKAASSKGKKNDMNVAAQSKEPNSKEISGESGKEKDKESTVSDTTLKSYQKKMAKLQQQIVNASIGLEHLFRELGQIYEAAYDSVKYRDIISCLPLAVGELLVDGYPLELMDGDVAHVPEIWVSAVLKEVCKKLDNPNVFVLSVLGLQSTGKSTMLNTAFGLQFNVSAGRCTRGAFMQLVPVDDELKQQTKCGYVMIVDTEGLRAPELNSIETQKHDNEIATFVIGLANSTLINIYGEVPGDMDDILQTSVHAFLRMNLAKEYSRPSCQFVHQNASKNSNRDVGLENFKQKLNKFTADAAKIEKCAERFLSFDDVIQFDDQTDVHNFPGLWKGDPPMAPVNQGYSKSAQMLKYHLVGMIQRVSQTTQKKILSGGKTEGLQFSSFEAKVRDLWDALLKENFVFSFRNSLEISAYHALEIQYSKWEWKFREEIIDWERHAENAISCAIPEKVEAKVTEKVKHLYAKISETHDSLKKDMETYFKCSENHQEIIVQWKGQFIRKLKTLSDELQEHAESHCTKLSSSKVAVTEFEKERQKYTQMIKDKVKLLIKERKQERDELCKSLERRHLSSQQLKRLLKQKLFESDKLSRYGLNYTQILAIQRYGQMTERSLHEVLLQQLSTEQARKILSQGLTEEELKHQFDEEWIKMISTLPFVEVKPVNIEAQVELQLIKCVKRDEGQFIAEYKKKCSSLKEWGATLEVKVIEGDHYCKIVGSVAERVWNWVSKHTWARNITDTHQLMAQKITEEVFNAAEAYLNKKMAENTDFNDSFTIELHHLLDKEITEKAEKVKDKLTFTPNYRFSIYLTACGYAVTMFEEMARKFLIRNDPRLYLEEHQKGPLFTQFKDDYYQTEAEEAIANTLCAHLQAPILEQIRKTIGSKLVGQMKTKLHFNSKRVLKVKILSDLYKRNEYNLYLFHAFQVKDSIHWWIREYTIQYCDEKPESTSRNTRLQIAAKNEVSRLIDVAEEVVANINEADVFTWLSKFCKHDHIIEELGVNLGARDLVAEHKVDNVKNLNLKDFKSSINAGLHNLSETLKASFDNIKCETAMKKWKDKPQDLLKELIGCTEQCPFCGEQCDLLEHDEKNEKHMTLVHRSACLAGLYDEKSNELAVEFCPANVDSECKFKSEETAGQWHAFKDYHEIYPHWYIEPDRSAAKSKYWQRFVGQYIQSLAETFKAKVPRDIPQEWKRMEWQEIEVSLKNAYKIQ